MGIHHGHPQDPRAEGRIASLLNLAGNVVVAGVQIGIGILFRSHALIADGLHNSGDVLHTLIAWIGFRIAEKPADEDHPYGHGNAESVAGILIGLVLLGTGIAAFWHGLDSVMNSTYATPIWPALAAAAVCAGIKELLSRNSFRVGERLNSPTLLAVAQDQRADALSAVGSVLGIGGAMLGYPILDPVAAMGIGAYVVFFNAFPVLRANFDVLMDAAPRTDLADRIRARYAADKEVQSVDSVRIHPLGPYYEIDLEITVDGDIPVRAGHEIAHRVRDEILESEKHVREVKVHVNPSPEKDDAVSRKP